MTQQTVKDLYTHLDQLTGTVELTGWVRTIRSSKRVGFIELNDGSSLANAQIVMTSEMANYEELTKLPLSATIQVVGELVATPKAQQPFEIQATAITQVGGSDNDYPLQKKKHSYEYLRTIAHLRPRTNTFYAVFKIRSLAAFAVHQYLQDHDFTYVNTPIITSSDSEGAGEMFQVTTLDMNHLPLDDQGQVDESQDFFKEKTNLTVSGQLPVEAFALAFRNVYTFGPTFRAENSHTSRHASEFWMIEPEMAFADLTDVMAMAEGLLKGVIAYLFDHAQPELAFLNEHVDPELIDRLQLTLDEDFARVPYTKAVELLQAAPVDFKVPVEWGTDLQAEHERYLTEEVYHQPIFLTDYPKEIKAFYMRNNDDGKTVAAADLLVPQIGELIGGSQREERFEQLQQKIKDFGLSEEEYQWYLELRKYGETKEAGFGIGFERLVMYVTGMSNIRDVIPYPRTPGNAEF
ncbi:asparaginyl-tRNA synthetase [Lapidilactobacillus dextrinicus DSM 20335]|uniref:Asparagine--tRNA ligase n=1 Tax=Lapidilactobacillus dextrinicus DSM 20335 TaxID=1423738 RepID=A0A0R2BJG0_9LACO|nr:asparagine--tRNA ligase [Lapidilactobacillus dextrinicus]KRM79248.1 asparaginyl-tRNA synthetase [Lapidilactobacillus dextrinicus DSM 20335]QFG46910.1 asparagine--tRNA ligase [Lapidilactobacillus dextrinicus]